MTARSMMLNAAIPRQAGQPASRIARVSASMNHWLSFGGSQHHRTRTARLTRT